MSVYTASITLKIISTNCIVASVGIKLENQRKKKIMIVEFAEQEMHHLGYLVAIVNHILADVREIKFIKTERRIDDEN